MTSDTSPRALPELWRIETVAATANGSLFVDGDWVESKDQDPAGKVRLTQLADVGEGEFRNRSDRWMRQDQADKVGVTYLEEGDLLIARMPDPLGRCCQVPKLNSPAVTVVDVAVLRVNPQIVVDKFMMWVLNSPEVRLAMEQLSSGTTRTRISRKNLGLIEIPIPPLLEQERIVEILEEQLSRLDAALASVRAVREKSAKFRRSLLHAAFSGTLTGHDTSDGNLPNNWKNHSIGQLADVKTGKIDVNAAVEDGQYPFFTCAQEIYRINDAPYEGRVVLVAGNGDLNVKYYEGKFNAYQRTYFLTVTDEEKLIPRYLYLFLEMYVEHLRKISIGTTIKYIKMGDLKDACIAIPPLAEQEKLIELLEEQLLHLDASLAIADVIEKKVLSLRRSLLHAAFSGNLTKEWREAAYV